jgi:hypothetical protein
LSVQARPHPASPPPRRLKSIIAASSCPADTRWEGSLRRNEFLLPVGARGSYPVRPPRQDAPVCRRRSRTSAPSAPLRRPHEASRECGRQERAHIAGLDLCSRPRSFPEDRWRSRFLLGNLAGSYPSNVVLLPVTMFAEIRTDGAHAPVPTCEAG